MDAMQNFKNLLIIIFVVGLFSVNAQTKLLHYWHFNNTLPLSGAGGTHFGTRPMNSDYSRPSVSTGYIRYVKLNTCFKDTGYWDNGTLGDTINQRTGVAGCCPSYSATTNNSYVRMRNPSDSMQMLMYIPTKNFKNIIIKYGSQASSTSSGQHRQNYDYSLDSGATFITTGLTKLFDSAGTSWGKITVDLKNLSTVNNLNKLMLRIRFGAPNTGTSGNNRFDNLSVEGDSIVSGTPNLIYENFMDKSLYTIFPNPTNNTLQMKGPLLEKKELQITSITGQVMPLSLSDNKQIIDVRQFNSGVYFLRVTDKESGESIYFKFLKD